MKCPACGYLSFDDNAECKKCGASLAMTIDGSVDDGEDSALAEGPLSLDDDSLDDDRDDDGPERPVTEEFILPAAEDSNPPEEEENRVGEAGEQGGGTHQGELFSLASDDGGDDDSEESSSGGELSFSSTVEVYPSEEEGFRDSGETEYAPIIDDSSSFSQELLIEEGAGFLTRSLAFCIDTLFLALVWSIFFAAALFIFFSEGFTLGDIFNGQNAFDLFIPFYLLGLFLSMCYYTFLPGRGIRTFGKALLRLEIHRIDGGEMTYFRSFLRWVGYLLSLTALGLGFLWVAFDERRRGWHDYLSGTWVEDLRRE